ncbi:MAG: hypothetical protein JSW60_09065 [Thermoplasmatales archaeon]|nr:MAG: hypothetical protein JSW60_09065 [Thermoplasmatales archaeon]
MNKSNVKKPLAVAVILLFIGVAFAPSINANISKEMVEFTTEVCGLNGGKQTVKLTQEEADEVEALFKSIRERLNATETREEAEEIFNDAVIELNKYGLLKGINMEELLNSLISKYRKLKIMKSIQSVFDKNSRLFNEDNNVFCLIAGKIDNSIIIGFAPIILLLVSLLVRDLGFLILFPLLFFGNLHMYSPLLPVIGNLILIGEYLWAGWNTWDEPAHGWVSTLGLKGKKTWAGPFYGDLFSGPGGKCLAVIGFTGIRIILKYENWLDRSYLFLGSALLADLSEEPPW